MHRAALRYYRRRLTRTCRAVVVPFLIWTGLGMVWPAMGAELDEARKSYQGGQYADCIRACNQAVADDDGAEEWRLLLARSLIAIGQYTNAASVIETNLDRFRYSIHLRLLGREIYRMNGRIDEAQGLIEEISRLASYRMWS